MGIRNIILFGANDNARTALNSLAYWDRVLFIADNDPALQGKIFGNTPVLHPDSIRHATFEQIRITSGAKEEIRSQLLEMGVPEAKILTDHLEFPSSQDLAYFESLRNAHAGRRAFLVGNGPSLRITDLTRLSLSGEISFAFNKIFLAFNETPFRPSYYLVEDPLVAENNKTIINRLTGFPKLFPERLRTFFHGEASTYFFSLAWEMIFPKRPRFNPDPSRMYWGSTVTYTALQWAIFLGCNPIYLIGVDFHFLQPAGISADGKVLISGGERNHFHPDYRPVGERWYVPNLHHQQLSFESARDYADAHGIEIFNSTRGGQLELFQRVNFDALF